MPVHDEGRVPFRLPTLQISFKAWQTMLRFAQVSEGEISGFFFVRQHEDDGSVYVIGDDDVVITYQTTEIGHAEAGEGEFARLRSEAILTDRVDELRGQWHSHPSTVYFSPEDMGTVDDLFQYEGWMISLVLNRNGDVVARYDQYPSGPMGNRIGVPMHVELLPFFDPDLEQRVRGEVAEMVTFVEPKAEEDDDEYEIIDLNKEEQTDDADEPERVPATVGS